MSLSAFIYSRPSHDVIKREIAKFGYSMTDFLEEAAAEKLARCSRFGELTLCKLAKLIEDAKAKAFDVERKSVFWETFDDDKLKRQIEAAYLWTQYFDWETANNGIVKEETDEEMLARLKKYNLT